MEHPLQKLWNKPERLVIGFMSGTSADGVDAALVRISGFGITTELKQLAFHFMPFDEATRREILRLAGGESATAADFCRINFHLGQLYCEAGDALCREANIEPSRVDLIGCHGQTFWHIPQEECYLGRMQHSTLQLGEAAVLAEHFKCPTVGDFRVRDVAAGGLGAPLVPYTEFLLYRSSEECVALQNIGGIGNVTVLPQGCRLEDVFGFDTGPGNMLMDAVTELLTNGEKHYDEDGTMAAAGQVNARLLAHLMQDPYLAKKPPKTTGREAYGARYLSQVLSFAHSHGISLLDTLSTVTRFTAETIAYGLGRFSPYRPGRMIVGGGGCYNRTLMAHLQELLPECKVMTNEDLGLDGNAKEAVAFALLANETIFASCNNAPGATGARHPVVMGKISL